MTAASRASPSTAADCSAEEARSPYSGDLDHQLPEAGPLALDIGERPAHIDRSNADPRGQRAVEQSFAEPRGELGGQTVPDHLLNHVVAERDAASEHDMRHHHARELEQRKRAGTRTI